MRGIDITWAGGEANFLLTIDLLRALQEKCDAGPAYILWRLANSRWMVSDVTETIRLGLEGGGLSKDEARRLTKIHVEDRPLAESILTAIAIITHAIYGGLENENSGEAKAAAVS